MFNKSILLQIKYLIGISQFSILFKIFSAFSKLDVLVVSNKTIATAAPRQ